MYTAATGNETSLDVFKENAIRQLNLEKAFNLKFTNYDRKDDMPTLRDMQEPIVGSSLAGWKMDKEMYNKMMDEYYEIHGWDKRTSFPTEKTLVDLDLPGVAVDLKKIGKLG
jgi:aldehyde:ferredoxin oxidoreductase